MLLPSCRGGISADLAALHAGMCQGSRTARSPSVCTGMLGLPVYPWLTAPEQLWGLRCSTDTRCCSAPATRIGAHYTETEGHPTASARQSVHISCASCWGVAFILSGLGTARHTVGALHPCTSTCMHGRQCKHRVEQAVIGRAYPNPGLVQVKV